ncbi:MAG: trypsin-like peptidase domain-containing protein, partial [Nitrosopumilus sp.]|nr:trypsin-like peptidase domain-containing protein [Nitrosopumilus sp.]
LRVVKFDEVLDMAVLKLNEELNVGNQLLTFANYMVDIGEQTYVSGFPLINTMGSQLKFTSGIISSLTGYNDDKKYLQTTAPIDPGNSGGPLIDQYGNIIGIISAKHSYGTNVGYALKINSLLNSNFISKTFSQKIKLSPQQIYSKAKKSVCIIKSYSL